jgi:hypothetical protein
VSEIAPILIFPRRRLCRNGSGFCHKIVLGRRAELAQIAVGL